MCSTKRLLVCLMLGLFVATGASADIFGTPFELEKAVHFPTLDGQLVKLDPGSYFLEREDAGLRIRPAAGGDGWLFRAGLKTHDKKIAGPVALSIPGKGEFPDLHLVVLLMPGGESLQMAGTYSGVMPRGFFDDAWSGVKDVASDVGDAASDAVDAGSDAANWVGDQVEDAADAAMNLAVDTFADVAPVAQGYLNDAENAWAAREQILAELENTVTDPARMQQLLEEAARQADAATAMAVKGLEEGWDAAVDAATWLYDQAAEYLQEMICKSMVYLVQGMDLMSQLSGPVASAVGEVLEPITAGITEAANRAAQETGIDQMMVDLQNALSDRMDEVAPQMLLVASLVDEIQAARVQLDQVRSLMLSTSVCELSQDELNSKLNTIMGPIFARLRSKATEIDVAMASMPAETAETPATPVSPSPEPKPVEPIQVADELPMVEEPPEAAVMPVPVTEAPVLEAARLDSKKIGKGRSTLKRVMSPRTRGEAAALDQSWTPSTREGHEIRGATACAQTFTVNKAGLLSKIALRVNRKAWTNAALTLELRPVDDSGKPVQDRNAVLATVTVDPSSFPLVFSEELTEIDISSAGIQVQPGEVLALTATNPSATYYAWWSKEGYGGGKGFVVDGMNWIELGGDFVFQTEIDTEKALVSVRGSAGESQEPSDPALVVSRGDGLFGSNFWLWTGIQIEGKGLFGSPFTVAVAPGTYFPNPDFNVAVGPGLSLVTTFELAVGGQIGVFFGDSDPRDYSHAIVLSTPEFEFWKTYKTIVSDPFNVHGEVVGFEATDVGTTQPAWWQLQNIKAVQDHETAMDAGRVVGQGMVSVDFILDPRVFEQIKFDDLDSVDLGGLLAGVVVNIGGEWQNQTGEIKPTAGISSLREVTLSYSYLWDVFN